MHKRVVDFIKKQYLFTLACTENNLPWANAFYYVFDEKENRLIYITGDQTHHAKVLRNNSRVAGTIFPQNLSPLYKVYNLQVARVNYFQHKQNKPVLYIKLNIHIT
ncbi:pyridoxamine 5'-phosphate oxidase family protein [Pasteurella multocida]|nr:pyridoxamine 5'-phosphate oxidase family protein [Pasteurella multocida]MDC4234118.1 pyridoxamine 5'-phosphate oxidase family protein [Pasteurella multocida]